MPYIFAGLIKVALDYRKELEDSLGVTRADGIFRFIPVFLGENFKDYKFFETRGPGTGVWKELEEALGDNRFNGVDLNDSSSFDSNFTKLLGTMLLRRSNRFVFQLINESLDDDGQVDSQKKGLEQLFASYLDMHDALENSVEDDDRGYENAIDRLSVLVKDRLLDILGRNDSKSLGKALQGFRLSYIKGACGESSKFFGSRERVIGELAKWLQEDPNSQQLDSNEIPGYLLKDRYNVVIEKFTRAIKGKVTREALVNAIRESKDNGSQYEKLMFRNYRPEDWKEVYNLVTELFEHLSYEEISEFFKNKGLLIQKKKVSVNDAAKEANDTQADNELKKENKTKEKELQDRIWKDLMESYPKLCKEPHIKQSSGAYVREISNFLCYKGPYSVIVGEDYKDKESYREDENIVSNNTPEKILITAICKRNYGNSEGCKEFIRSFAEEHGILDLPNKLPDMLGITLDIEDGDVLQRLSAKSRPKDSRLDRDFWVKVCGELGIKKFPSNMGNAINQVWEKIGRKRITNEILKEEIMSDFSVTSETASDYDQSDEFLPRNDANEAVSVSTETSGFPDNVSEAKSGSSEMNEPLAGVISEPAQESTERNNTTTFGNN
ncbi:hypothetical protein AGMMS50256_34200 [Betaproteobacteria bacterium]|nr:hypothetical protein AGMMS50256_34200 [Betaproteobacteria bacterium]